MARRRQSSLPPVPHADTPHTVPATRDADVEEVLEDIATHYDSWDPVLKEKWATGFITWLYEQGVDPNELGDQWNELELFIWFLDHQGAEVSEIDHLRDFHVSEFVNEFWRRKVLGPFSVDEKRQYVITVRDFYAYLKDAGVIDAKTYDRVQRAAEKVVGQAGELGHIRRPPPKGGEMLSAVHIPSKGEFKFTFNDHWLTLVCREDFDWDWQRTREAAASQPAAAAKQRLIDRLIDMARQTDGSYPEKFFMFADITHQDVREARDFFYRGTVEEINAWAGPPEETEKSEQPPERKRKRRRRRRR